MSGRYDIYSSKEHCHVCGEVRQCTVRRNTIRYYEGRKTALCSVCAEKFGTDEPKCIVCRKREPRDGDDMCVECNELAEQCEADGVNGREETSQ